MLKDKVAIVVGGSGGLGSAIARKFAANGAAIVLAAEEIAGLEMVADSLKQSGARTAIFSGDIAKPDFSIRMVNEVLKTFGTVDIAVNASGVITRTPVEELSLEDWQRVIDVNLNGTFHFCRAVLPVMREKKAGKIINISSQMARLPHPSASPSYEVSKAGVAALTRHLALHYAKYNICVNAIAPGSFNTRMPMSMSPEAREKLRNAIPLGRLGEPDEVADCALFLASSMADYITGATLDVNGGSLMA